MRRATQPLELVYTGTAGPYATSLGGSRCVVIFVDNASRLQRPYGARKNSVANIFYVVKRFVADMGVPRTFRTDNDTEYSNSMFVGFCNGLGTRLELMAPYTSQQNGPVESTISRAFKAGHAVRLGVPQLYRDTRLKEVRVASTLQERSFGWSRYSGIEMLQQGGNISEQPVASVP